MKNTKLERAKVVEEAKSWLGTPYHPHGRIKGSGVDCAMLPAEVYEAVGLIPRVVPEHYPIDWHMHRNDEKYMDTVTGHAFRTDNLFPGNFILYKWGRCFAHGAIIVAWPVVIHAFVGQGVVLAHGNDGRLKDREHRIYTLWDE